jgi:hypothetical protein
VGAFGVLVFAPLLNDDLSFFQDIVRANYLESGFGLP